MNRNVTDSRNFCYALTEETIRLLENVFKKYDIHVGILVETIDGYELIFNKSEEFFQWSQNPHSPIKNFSFSTLRSNNDYSVVVAFNNYRNSFFMFMEEVRESAIFWSLKGSSDVITSVNQDIISIISTTKQNYSFLFGRRVYQTLLFDFVTLYIPVIIVFSYILILTTSFLSGSGDFEPASKYFRLPNGTIIEAVPAIPVLSEASSTHTHNGFWKYFGFPFLIICFAVRFSRKFYPIGTFDFGYDKVSMASTIKSRDWIFLSLILAGVFAGVMATLIVGYFS